MSYRAAAATATLATATTLAGYYFLRRAAAGVADEARERPREGVGRSEGEDDGADGEDEEDEVCAICLSKPELPCRTQCGHRFCTECFLCWWQRQPAAMGGPNLGEARCPLCTQLVTRIAPEFGAARGGLPMLRAVLLYNWGAGLTRRMRHVRRWLDGARQVGEKLALLSFAGAGVVWEVARNELNGSLVQVPAPEDERARFFCIWQVLATALYRNQLDLPALATASSFMLKLTAMQRDCRHALLLLDVGASQASTISQLCVSSAWCRLGHLIVRLLHPRLPEGMRRLTPPLLHAFDVVGLLADVAMCALHVRLELAGLRGLVALIRWRRQASIHARALEPFERLQFGVWPLELTTARFCRVWYSRTRSTAGPFQNLELPWSSCLQLYAVPLRAMRAFYGESFMREVLPDWAVEDVRQLPPLRA